MRLCPLTIARGLERLIEATGRLTAWCVPLIVVLVGVDVAARYFLHQGSVAVQELEWHLFALVFLLGGAYTLKHDEHVRVDVLYRSHWLKPKQRALIDLFGTLFMLLPFCILVLAESLPFVHNAWLFDERSADPGGLGQRWLIKAAIPLGFALLIMQGLANVMHALVALRGDGAQTDTQEGGN